MEHYFNVGAFDSLILTTNPFKWMLQFGLQGGGLGRNGIFSNSSKNGKIEVAIGVKALGAA